MSGVWVSAWAGASCASARYGRAVLKWRRYTVRIRCKWRSLTIRTLSNNSRRKVPITRSQIALARGAWGGLVRIRMASAVKTASNPVVNRESRSWSRNVTVVARSARCGIDTSVMQYLPHRGGGDPMAEPDQLALNTPMPPGKILGSHANHQILDRRCGRWTSRSATCAVVPLARDQPAVPGQDRGGIDRQDLCPSATRQQAG